ncbi:MAG: hypothetical protein A3G49_04370 [Candidatus Sungbacteria bacterium RIFCSPLOWO2_12_FULL_41_11]|uniref:Uncharacterized protein n=1 Tax=Candidatus Sungbacteria bacterium RIFCSPLOWO2_12_FULL_41_11 TaxID=1802286 RepID=A0A1G2LPZ0_9BACT|nr:MAG: hypothetical protein UV01_C0001G0026 [Parcubacteria group bacterium GW2011_GWA2_42_14]OGZ97529.1 MAG: hypothetical protein A3D41_01440 [Candidatus Sungbacteria bacterium RIFCSPHIGHO2_02_FULL_41_12b]OHA12912.1 MAG: hypothetical protein A3G49_04370 [Candidatus Sungbacteria bacterium RIFCSPLOWO2_12_FULL_41_11]
MLGWLWIFFLASAVQVIGNIVVFWQIQNAAKLELLGMRFPNIGTFWLGYCIILLPIFIPMGVLNSYIYWYGYHNVFSERVWLVQLTVWFSSILIMFFTAWLYLGELPAKNMVVALLFLVCALVAILWK